MIVQQSTEAKQITRPRSPIIRARPQIQTILRSGDPAGDYNVLTDVGPPEHEQLWALLSPLVIRWSVLTHFTGNRNSQVRDGSP